MANQRSGRHDGRGEIKFSPTIFVVLVFLSVILVAFDRPANRSPLFSSIRAGFTDLAAPVLEIAAQPIRFVKGIAPYFRRQGQLAEENARMQQDLMEARGWVELAGRLQDRIEVYEQALNVEGEATGERIGAWTVADPDGPFVHARLIGRGQAAGVRDGFPVINVYGLVGRVTETGQRSARVLLLTDLNSRVPVMADRSNARAILIGDNSDFPRLDYVGRNPDIQPGDRIVTSGDDGILPRGLPVGEAIATRDGQWRIRLYSDQAPIDFVWVWPYERVVAPEAEPVLDEAMAANPDASVPGLPVPDASVPDASDAEASGVDVSGATGPASSDEEGVSDAQGQ
ncbi:rod shape-determining protein MreC [Maricaulis sp. D1M11]|uniref:rod shape-determining protein MreC n=1 Tax=Maricaulis sp. D1M11 TaxID=3076117 RepID=UPI0039B56EB3